MRRFQMKAVARATMLALLCASGAAMASGKSVPNPAVRSEPKQPDGSTPLQWAVFKGDAAEVARLLRAGANVAETNIYGVAPLQLAAETGDAAILKLLLKAGADVDSPNSEGETALMTVVRTGNVAAAKLLIKHGAQVNAVEQFGGQTALMWANARRHPEMVELLLSKGAQIDARSAVRDWHRRITAEGRAKDVNSGGLTPLLYAARDNCLACVNVLIEHGVDINLPDPDGVAPLTIAMMNDNWDVAKQLVLAGAVVNQWDIYGQSPLHVAIEASNAQPGGFGGSAAQRKSIDPPDQSNGSELIALLVERGANPNQQMYFRAPRGFGSVASGSRGTTPFHRACATGNLDAIKLLLAHGADVKLNQADGQTAMMLALAARRDENSIIEILRVLHDAGADATVVAKYHHLQRLRGGTALHVATRLGLKKAAAELVSYGADVNAKDPDGLTALDYAMSRGYIPFLAQKAPVREDVAKVLRDLGANVELAKTPDWPPVGPPIGYEATIWPL